MNLSPHIRPYTSSDQPVLLHILQAVGHDDSAMSAYYRFGLPSASDAAQFVYTLVAEVDHTVVGYGSIWTNRVHPHSLYVGIVVHPQYQRRGIGGDLYTRLMHRRGSYTSLPLQTATWSDYTSAIRFLTQRGFHEDKRTYIALFQLADVQLPHDHTFVQHCVAADYHISSLADVAPTAERQRNVVALATEIYRATHASNPPAALTEADWTAIVFNDLIEAGCFIALNGTEYGGISLLYGHDQPATAALGWIGVTAAARHVERPLMLALLQHQIDFAQRNGYRLLEAEIDTTDPGAMLLLEHLSAPPERAWITFRRNC